MAYGLSEDGYFECKHFKSNAGQVLGYAYGIANNVPAFVWDKPGSNWTGIGANGYSDEIQFGPCAQDSNGVYQWQSSPTQTWRFKGNVAVEGSISAGSLSATSCGDGSMTLYPHYSNEVNFGGSNNSSTIYFGYRAVDSKPIPSSFIFGGSSGSAGVTAGGFYVGSSRKLKKKIKATKYEGLEILDKVKVVDFFYKTDKECKSPKVGFIAEDTPEILTGPEHARMDTVNCIGILIKAVQELNEKILNIEKKLKDEESIYG